MKISSKFTKPNWNLNNLLFGAISSLLIFVGILSFALLNSTTQLEELEINRHKLVLLGTELKESSDELTRLCRTYVVTGESKWENQYWQLLDVRNGIKPWPNGSKIALHDSLIKLGIAPLENQKLLLAEKNSNDLVWTERVAFNAMKGIFADSLKHFTIMSKPNPLFAQKIMFDKKYIEDKEKIARSVNSEKCWISVSHMRSTGRNQKIKVYL